MPKICIIGGGFSGMCASIKLKEKLGINSYTLFDENSNFGGTWLNNTYPGCACDVMTHLYSYSFELNPDWTQTYASSGEIWDYMIRIAKKYDLYKNAKFNTQVKVCKWEPALNQWRVTIFNKKSGQTKDLFFDFVIAGLGGLRVPVIPEEFKSFTGPMMHTAEWDNSVSLKNKKVAIIGSGSSGVQTIPVIAQEVKELYCYQRKPAWVAPRMQNTIPDFVKKTFAYIPFLMFFLRIFLYLFHELIYPIIRPDSYINKFAQNLSTRYMKSIIKDPELRKKLTPNYHFFCKRIALSETYFQTFLKKNVHLIRDEIEKVEGNSIITKDGEKRKFDVLILATGFKVQELWAPMEIITETGESALELLNSHSVTSFYGVTSHLTPNFFSILGPNSGLGYTSALFPVECQTDLIMKILKETIKQGAIKVQVKESSEKVFMEEVKSNMKGTVWGAKSCGSWYIDKFGEVSVFYPKRTINFWWETKNMDFKNFQFSYTN